jgi:hypothetical protein
MAMLIYAGDVGSGERVIAPFRALTAPLADMVKPMRYPEIYQPEEGEYHPVAPPPARCSMKKQFMKPGSRASHRR